MCTYVSRLHVNGSLTLAKYVFDTSEALPICVFTQQGVHPYCDVRGSHRMNVLVGLMNHVYLFGSNMCSVLSKFFTEERLKYHDYGSVHLCVLSAYLRLASMLAKYVFDTPDTLLFSLVPNVPQRTQRSFVIHTSKDNTSPPNGGYALGQNSQKTVGIIQFVCFHILSGSLILYHYTFYIIIQQSVDIQDNKDFFNKIVRFRHASNFFNIWPSRRRILHEIYLRLERQTTS